jgi:hypothetical protein
MALSLGQTGTADSVDAEYFNWESGDRRFMIHMHLDAIDGLARDLIEGIPAETGGVLLGQVGRGERPVVWIERYQRVDIDFALNAEGQAAFEKAARRASEDGELTVVGYYRAHLRPGFQLEDADLELLGRYFTDPEDLVLLLRPEKNKAEILAQFMGRDAEPQSGFQVLGTPFPFRGRVLRPAEAEDDPEERTGRTGSEPPPPHAGVHHGVHRRLVPDFQPAPESPRPAREFFMEARPATAPLPEPWESAHGWRFPGKWWPILAALLVVGVGGTIVLQQSSRHETTEVRPLGLYVDASGQSWRVSWNTSATGLPGSRVKLFVRDGEQNQIDLQPQNVQSGTYLYTAKGSDVTFRLEVVDKSGHLSADSFRILERAPAPPPAAPTPAPVEKPAVAANADSHFTAPKAIHRVPPVVPASLRPRIHGSIPLDVRVKIDAHGRVTSAVPVSKPHSGVESFLAARAVYAAKQWRFEPARQDGKAVPGMEIIHFVFDK